MARNIALVFAALLLFPAAGRAVGLGDVSVCEREQSAQQRGGNQAAAKPDPKADKDKPSNERPKLWWIDAKRRAELGITDQQSAAVDAIWQKTLPSQRERREKLIKLEDALSQLTDGADEAAVIAQVERVESLRAELNKVRTLMLYRMHRILTAEQRAKVKAMFEQHEPPRRGSSPGKS